MQESTGELRQLLDHVVTQMIGESATELADMIESTIHRTVSDKYPWPGNVRELEQAVRRILITGHYANVAQPKSQDLVERLVTGIEAESLDADTLLAGYCGLLYENSGNYEAVARQTNLDRRTVKKYVKQGLGMNSPKAGV